MLNSLVRQYEETNLFQSDHFSKINIKRVATSSTIFEPWLPIRSEKMSTKKANTAKSTSKASKSEKASFDKVINALEKEKEAFVTPKSQSTNFERIHIITQLSRFFSLFLEILFWVASVIAAVAPLVLFWGGGSLSESKYWSAIYEGRVHENVIWYLICVVISVVILVHSYNVQATRTRRTLLLSRYSKPVTNALPQTCLFLWHQSNSDNSFTERPWAVASAT